ncbi:MAG: hypothetical protein GXN99_01905 [Candidatus Nanohaloarchaeota archaeon]|nr:hypothetical protein [Candidatus Nanohaloarchaeota archaeon]
MSKVEYATKQDIKRLEKKIDNLTKVIKRFIEEEVTMEEEIKIKKRLEEIENKEYSDYEEFVKKELNINV